MAILVDRVNQVLSNYIADGKAFTIYEVTKAVKADGGSFVSHSNDVKPIVESFFENFADLVDYDTTHVKFTPENSTTPVEARVFYPLDDYDVLDEYVESLNGGNKKTQPKSNIVPINNNVTSASKPAPIKVNVRHDGSIEIPKKVVETIGIGSDFSIKYHPNSITVEVTTKQITTRKLIYGTRIKLGDHLNSATHAFIHVVSNGFFITV
jgi:hypothetical protein